MRKFDEKRKKTVEELNLPESCIYCKGLGFNCSSCEKIVELVKEYPIKERKYMNYSKDLIKVLGRSPD